MKAYLNNPCILCPKCERLYMRALSHNKDAKTITVVCDCDGILYTMKRQSVDLEPVQP